MQTLKINSSEFTSRIENANLSRAESAYAILQNAILKGLLNPGQKLDFENKRDGDAGFSLRYKIARVILGRRLQSRNHFRD